MTARTVVRWNEARDGGISTHEPLTWVLWPDGVIAMVCPNGHVGDLEDHEIDDEGAVEPSVECPYDGCDFHAYVKLDRYVDGLDATPLWDMAEADDEVRS